MVKQNKSKKQKVDSAYLTDKKSAIFVHMFCNGFLNKMTIIIKSQYNYYSIYDTSINKEKQEKIISLSIKQNTVKTMMEISKTQSKNI